MYDALESSLALGFFTAFPLLFSVLHCFLLLSTVSPLFSSRVLHIITLSIVHCASFDRPGDSRSPSMLTSLSRPLFCIDCPHSTPNSHVTYATAQLNISFIHRHLTATHIHHRQDRHRNIYCTVGTFIAKQAYYQSILAVHCPLLSSYTSLCCTLLYVSCMFRVDVYI